MQGDEKNKSGNNATGRPELLRQDSFIKKMDIYTNGIFTRGAS